MLSNAYASGVDEPVIEVDLDAVREFDGQEDRMLNFVSDIGGSDIVVESFGVVLNNYLALALAFVFPLYELLLNRVVPEGLHERTELLLLVVPRRTA